MGMCDLPNWRPQSHIYNERRRYALVINLAFLRLLLHDVCLEVCLDQCVIHIDRASNRVCVIAKARQSVVIYVFMFCVLRLIALDYWLTLPNGNIHIRNTITQVFFFID